MILRMTFWRPGGLDFLPPLGADAVHAFQIGGTLLDDIEDAFAEFADEFLGIDRPDPLDHVAPEIFLNALDGRWRRAGQHLGFELQTELTVPNPDALRRHPLAGTDAR